MEQTTSFSMTDIQKIHSFDDLKAFEARVSKMKINWTLRDKLIRQATENFINACPTI